MPTDLLVLLSPKNIIIFVLVLSRFSGLFFTMPLFSTYPIPMQVKVWLAVVVSLVIFPSVISANLPIPESMPAMVVFLFKEFAIGCLMGFLVNLVFMSCQIGAEMLGVQSGLSMSNVLDPATGTNAPVLAQLYVMPASLIFIGINAHHWLFLTLSYSFKAIPPGFDMFFSPTMVNQIITLCAQIFIVAIGIVLPVFGVLFVLEVLLGFTSKMMPKMNVFMVAIPLKVYTALFLILIFLAPTCNYISTLIETRCLEIMRMFSGG